MGDAIEALRAMSDINREERRERHAQWREENMALLRADGALDRPGVELRPEAVLFREHGKPKVDFYASTGRWRAHGRTFRGGAKKFLAWYATQWSMAGNP